MFHKSHATRGREAASSGEIPNAFTTVPIAAGETQPGGYPGELAGYLELEPALLPFSAPLVLRCPLHDAQRGRSAATVTRAGLSGKPQAIDSLLSSTQVEQVCGFGFRFCFCFKFTPKR